MEKYSVTNVNGISAYSTGLVNVSSIGTVIELGIITYADGTKTISGTYTVQEAIDFVTTVNSAFGVQ